MGVRVRPARPVVRRRAVNFPAGCPVEFRGGCPVHWPAAGDDRARRWTISHGRLTRAPPAAVDYGPSAIPTWISAVPAGPRIALLELFAYEESTSPISRMRSPTSLLDNALQRLSAKRPRTRRYRSTKRPATRGLRPFFLRVAAAALSALAPYIQGQPISLLTAHQQPDAFDRGPSRAGNPCSRSLAAETASHDHRRRPRPTPRWAPPGSSTDSAGNGGPASQRRDFHTWAKRAMLPCARPSGRRTS